MKKNFFDGRTFVLTFDELIEKTREGYPVFVKISNEEEFTGDELNKTIIKVAELENKFIYYYCAFTGNMWATCYDIDESGDILFNEENQPILGNDDQYITDLLKQLGAENDFIEKFLNIYCDLWTGSDLYF